MTNGKRLVIVGGVAGGAAAAARARRLSEEARIVLFERGGEISFANCGMPYHIGGTIPQRERLLVQTAEGMRSRYRIDVRTLTEVVRIDRAARTVQARELVGGREVLEPYDALIISPGAAPVRPPIPGLEGERVFSLRGLADMDAIRRAAERDRGGAALVLGGGYIGLELAEALRARSLGVTLVELSEQVFAPIDPEMAEPVHQHLRAKGVELKLGTSLTSVHPEPGGLRAVLSSGQEVRCSMLIVAAGIRPEARLAREAGLAIGPSGGVVVDEHMRTSDPSIYAVGDAVETVELLSGRPILMPLAGLANRQGRIAADNALGRPSVLRKSLGTAICKVFDLAVACVGLSEKSLRRLGLPYEKVYVHPASHAGYYPGASPIALKLLFDPGGGKVLGAQAVGTAGVDKRIDVLAVAIRAGLTVFDLEDLELAYAPPYGSARDVVNYAGSAAANALRGDVEICHAAQAASPRLDQFLLDVRTAGEVQAGTIPGALNVPIDELRDRLGELPRDKEILAFCRVGLRGYLACRILAQNGFRCRNLSGGWLTYSAAVKSMPEPPPAPPEIHQDAGEQDDSLPEADRAATRAPPAAKEVDCAGMQCPGPILRLSREIATLQAGEALGIVATDPGFAADVQGWCRATGNILVELRALPGGRQRAVVLKSAAPSPPTGSASAAPAPPTRGATPPQVRQAEACDPSAARGADGSPWRPCQNTTFVVFSGDLDRVMASFVMANGAAALGGKVTMFFTFWGLSALRREDGRAGGKSPIERMFGWMIPRGAARLKLSKMNLAGLGTAMMKGRMRARNVPSLPELIASARAAGVRLVACAMSMDVMGLRREELIDGVELGGVASFLAEAHEGNVTLFI